MPTLTPNLNWRTVVPAPGWPIDWGRMPYRLQRCVVFEGEGGGVLNNADGTARGGIPLERVWGEQNGIRGTTGDTPQSHPFGHRWITWPPANRTGPWIISPQVGLTGPLRFSQEKMTFAWASWMTNADGAARNGPIWNGSAAGAPGFLLCTASGTSAGDCGMAFGGNGGDVGAGLSYTDTSVTTGMHSFLYGAGTGVESPAGVSLHQDGVLRNSKNTWTGASKPALGGLSFSIGGNGPNGNPWCGLIRYVYIFDDFITDTGFAELLYEAPYYFFLEPVDPYFSLPPLPPVPPPPSFESVSAGVSSMSLKIVGAYRP